QGLFQACLVGEAMSPCGSCQVESLSHLHHIDGNLFLDYPEDDLFRGCRLPISLSPYVVQSNWHIVCCVIRELIKRSWLVATDQAVPNASARFLSPNTNMRLK